jgi:hypothetical protein
MVGNDIVDLLDRDSDAGSLSPRFDARVFCDSERDAIASSSDPARERWRIWAAKEASYKLARQRARARLPDVIWSPIRFRVALDIATGIVRHDDETFRIQIHEGEDFIHAVALPHHLLARDASGSSVKPTRDGVLFEHRRIASADPALQSSEVRDLAREIIARRLGHPEVALAIRSEDRIPSVWLDDRRLPLALSFSHHGRYVAMACCEVPTPTPRIQDHDVEARLLNREQAPRSDGALP